MSLLLLLLLLSLFLVEERVISIGGEGEFLRFLFRVA